MSEASTPDNGEVINDYQLFYMAVNNWQDTFDSFDDPEDPELLNLRNPAIKDIDLYCPYKGELVTVTGFGEIPIIERSEEGIEVMGYVEHAVNVTGRHNGVDIRTYQGPQDQTERLKIMHMITIDNHQAFLDEKRFAFQTTLFAAYFDIAPTTSIMDFQEMESLFQLDSLTEETPFDLEESLKQLSDYSRRTKQLIESQDYKKRAKHERQTILRDLINEAEEKVQLRNADFKVTTDQGFVLLLAADEIHALPVLLADRTIEGTILGLESLENMLLSSSRPIRSEAALEGKEAELCLVVAPSPQLCEELQLNPQQVLYLPIDADGVSPPQ